MECNKDEAQRAKEIAERKFFQKDLNGAKKIALKAQTLFPQLDGISQFIIALDVHLMAESRVAGEKDWYAIMSLSPSADESTVKKQYRHLVLHLHPDKNRSTGAEGAFKLVQEAFDVLKDKYKRNIFDQKRKTHAMNGHKISSGAGFSGSNGFNNQEKGVCPDMRSKFQAQSAPQKATQTVPHPFHSTAGCSAQGAPQTAARPVPQQPKRSTASCSAKGVPQTAARPVPQNTARMGPRSSKPCTTEHHMPGATYRFEKPSPQTSVASTFWTRCTSCKMWFEYSWIHRNLVLCCPSCIAPFYAADTGQQPVSRYNFVLMQDWKRDNSGSSENVSAGLGSQQQKCPYKRMRGEGGSDVNGGSCEKAQRVGSVQGLQS